jgi:hypothetical protein
LRPVTGTGGCAVPHGPAAAAPLPGRPAPARNDHEAMLTIRVALAKDSVLREGVSRLVDAK